MFLSSLGVFLLTCGLFVSAVVPQDFQDQALPRQEAETEQADSSVDQNEDRQQDQVSLGISVCTRFSCLF